MTERLSAWWKKMTGRDCGCEGRKTRLRKWWRRLQWKWWYFTKVEAPDIRRRWLLGAYHAGRLMPQGRNRHG